MPKYIEKAERMHLPALAMRGLIAFPAIPLTFEVADEADAGVCLEAERTTVLYSLSRSETCP